MTLPVFGLAPAQAADDGEVSAEVKVFFARMIRPRGET
jgi:hypothetical protein